MKRWFELSRVWIALIAPLALSACQSAGTIPLLGSLVGSSQPTPAVKPNSDAAPAKPPLPTRAALAADPLRFKGLTSADVTGFLGAPSYQRKDADAEIWQYYGPASNCVLDLFFYPEQGRLTVAHSELRMRAAGGKDGACLAQILDGKRG